MAKPLDIWQQSKHVACNLDTFASGDPNVCEIMQNNDYIENIPQINYKRTQVN